MIFLVTEDLTGDEIYTLEDMVYDNFHDATQQGSATYEKEEFLDMFNVAESVKPTSIPEVDRSSEVAGVALVDNYEKAAYGFVEHRDDEVEVDIKCFGDRAGVVNYIEQLPSNGYIEGVETVSGQAWRQSTVEAGEHPMNVETDRELPEPAESPEEGFTNAQAERIKSKVLEE